MENSQVVLAGLVECLNLNIKSLHLLQICRFGEAFAGGLLRLDQPRCELLQKVHHYSYLFIYCLFLALFDRAKKPIYFDSGAILCPALDVRAVFLALGPCGLLQSAHIVRDPGQLLLVGLRVRRHLLACQQNTSSHLYSLRSAH